MRNMFVYQWTTFKSNDFTVCWPCRVHKIAINHVVLGAINSWEFNFSTTSSHNLLCHDHFWENVLFQQLFTDQLSLQVNQRSDPTYMKMASTACLKETGNLHFWPVFAHLKILTMVKCIWNCSTPWNQEIEHWHWLFEKERGVAAGWAWLDHSPSA